MEIKEFIEHFSELFYNTEPSEFKPETVFHDLDEYTSVIALSIILMIDEEYDIAIKGDDIRNSETVEDLFNFVKAKA